MMQNFTLACQREIAAFCGEESTSLSRCDAQINLMLDHANREMRKNLSVLGQAFTGRPRRLFLVEWNLEVIWSSVGWVLMVLGLLGSLVPVLPGPILVLGGALVVAAGDGFDRIGWPTVAVLVILTLAAWGSELVLTTTFTRRAGATWRTVAGAIVGGIAGGMLFGVLFTIVGSLVGAAVGAMVGVMFVERVLNQRAWPDAWRVSRNYLAGCLLGRVAELSLSLMMVGIVAWQSLR